MKIIKLILILLFVTILFGLMYFLYMTWVGVKPVDIVNSPEKPITSAKSYKVIAIGDIACAPPVSVTAKTCRMEAVANAITQAKPDALLLLGDIQYDKGELAYFETVYDKYFGALAEVSYPAPGNHEYGTPKANGYFTYWAQKQKNVGAADAGYYAFSLGNWKIFALNSNCVDIGGCGADSAQGKWLQEELSKDKSKCSLAYWHHPVFTSGKYQSDNKTKERGYFFWQALGSAKSEVVLNGHDHLYERFAKQHADGTAGDDGMRQFTAGTGGKSLYALNQAKTKNHEFGTDADFGYLELTLKPTTYDWIFRNIDGKELDSGTDECR